jgi:c-di-GMP-related signal transduction protein
MHWRFWENAKSVVGSGWVATLGAGQGKTADLVLSAMVRARFCELVSPKIPYGESELFLMGMLSMMDVILEIPMSQVLDNVPIDQEQGGAARRRQPSAPVLSTHAGPRVRRVEDRH